MIKKIYFEIMSYEMSLFYTVLWFFMTLWIKSLSQMTITL
jgi:hypothetical protein